MSEAQVLSPAGVLDREPEDHRIVRARRHRRGHPNERKNVGLTLSAPVRAAWARAAEVTEQELAGFAPTPDACLVGEGLLTGAASIGALKQETGLSAERVREVLQAPVTMAWLCRRVHEYFRHRIAFVDSALYARAMGGDVAAIKLWYERHDVLAERSQTFRHEYTVQFNPQALTTEELRKLVQDNGRLLANSTRIVDVGPGGASSARAALPGPEGAGEESAGRAAPVLQKNAGEAPEAA